MLTLQQIAEIAARHLTAMADAMIAAVIEKAARTGEALSLPERELHAMAARPVDVTRPGKEWQTLVEQNSDTRWCHV